MATRTGTAGFFNPLPDVLELDSGARGAQASAEIHSTRSGSANVAFDPLADVLGIANPLVIPYNPGSSGPQGTGLQLGDYVFGPTWYPADRSVQNLIPSGKLARAHGGRQLGGYRQAVRLLIRGGLVGPTEPIGGVTNLREEVDRLRAALQATPSPFFFGETDWYYRSVQAENTQEAYSPTYWKRILESAEIALVSGDPFRYNIHTNLQYWDLPSNGSQRTITNGANGGNAPAAPKFTFRLASGSLPVTLDLTLTNLTTAEQFSLSGPAEPNDTIQVDCLKRTVTINYADARTVFDGSFMSLAAGDSLLQLNGMTAVAWILATWLDRRW